MNNSEILKKIELVREVRRDLGSFRFLTNEEKAMTLKALNDYEFTLEQDITRNLNTKKELDAEGIPNDIEVVEVPLDTNRPLYKEFSEAGSYEELDANIIRLVDALFKAPSFDLEDSKKKVLLEALKEYVKYLQNLKLKQDNNRNNYPELYQIEEINPSPEVIASRPQTPKLSQPERFSELYNKIRSESDNKTK